MYAMSRLTRGSKETEDIPPVYNDLLWLLSLCLCTVLMCYHGDENVEVESR